MRRWSRALLVSLLFVTMPAVADGTAVNESPLDRQVLDIAKDLRCTVCQNQPISESNADLARDMRAIIREQLQAGKTKPEIMDYFVQRYGDYVLLKPPGRGAGFVVWAVPAAVFALLAGFAALFLRRRKHASESPPPLSDEDTARVARARDDARRT